MVFRKEVIHMTFKRIKSAINILKLNTAQDVFNVTASELGGGGYFFFSFFFSPQIFSTKKNKEIKQISYKQFIGRLFSTGQIPRTEQSGEIFTFSNN